MTDDADLSRTDFVDRAAEALRAGGTRLALHLRGPRTAGRRLFDLAARLQPVAHEAGARLLINDRIDVAATAGAHGVHLGQRSLSVVAARRLLSTAPSGSGGRPGVRAALIGVSVHSVAEAEAARGADYLLVGTLYPTPSHPGHPGGGPALIREIRDAVGPVPLIAIGGVTPDRLPEIREAGAHGIAVLRGVWEQRYPADAVERYLTAWNENPSPSRSA